MTEESSQFQPATILAEEPGPRFVDLSRVWIAFKIGLGQYAFRMNIPCGRDVQGVNIVNRFSTVVGSITEVTNPPVGVGDAFMGAAPMKIGSIAPKDDGSVDVSGYINWDHGALWFEVSIIIFR